MRTRIDARRGIAEGLADYWADRALQEACECVMRVIADLLDPCCHDCGYVEILIEDLQLALKLVSAQAQ